MSLKILIVDDHAILRERVRALISNETDMEVTAEAGTGVEAVRIARNFSHDVIIMDISMPEMNGIDATRLIVRERPDARILAFSMEADLNFVAEVLKAGASGYLLKDVAFTELTTAIRTVAAGETYLAPRLTETIVREYLRRIPQRETHGRENLTIQEQNALQMIINGKSSEEITEACDASLKRLENQRCILQKLGLNTITPLTKYAIGDRQSSLG